MEGSQDDLKLLQNIILREKLEKQATAALTTGILTKLNISIETLPQKSQHLLQKVDKLQTALDIDTLDSAAISLRKSTELSKKLEEEYEILKLKQLNAKLQVKINRNNKFLEDLRQELVCSRESLAKQDPNPENIQEQIRKLKQKLTSYEESLRTAEGTLSALSAAAGSGSVERLERLERLAALAAAREAVQREAQALRRRADDAALVRQAASALGYLGNKY